MVTGSCLCEGVRFRLDGELGPVRYCHCNRCRRATGTAFSANAPVLSKDFQFIAGEELIAEYEMSPGVFRAFCSSCGSALFVRAAGTPKLLRLRIGTLRGEVDVEPEAHVWVGSKANWFEITDRLPQFDEGGQSFSGPGS